MFIFSFLKVSAAPVIAEFSEFITASAVCRCHMIMTVQPSSLNSAAFFYRAIFSVSLCSDIDQINGETSGAG
jgi:hypothetical protein